MQTEVRPELAEGAAMFDQFRAMADSYIEQSRKLERAAIINHFEILRETARGIGMLTLVAGINQAIVSLT